MTENPIRLVRDNEPRRTVKLVERASLKASESMMHNYSNSQAALLDLVDNAIDNRIDGKQSVIRVTISRDEVIITNRGGQGLDLDGLDRYLQWGVSAKTDDEIGQYGVGGKSAAGFLGHGLDIRCSAFNSREEYRLVDDKWGVKPEGHEQEHIVEIGKAQSEEGYFRIRIFNLNSSRRIDAKTIASKLGDYYKPLLEDKAISISVNNTEVIPAKINYVLNNPEIKPVAYKVQNPFGDFDVVRLGVMQPGQDIEPGFKCYYRGRRMEDGQFFGYPTPAQSPQFARFIGEAYLDKLRVTMNKSGFVKDEMWMQTAIAINKAISGYMEKVATMKVESKVQLEKYEHDLAKEAKRILEHIVSQTQIINREMLAGGAHARFHPGPKTEESHEPISSKNQGEIKGRTAPHINAKVEGPGIKRWGVFFDWRPIDMGNDMTVAEVVEENGKQILKINVSHPMYQAEKRAGESALELYHAMIGVKEIAKKVCEGQSIEEYNSWIDKTMRLVGDYFNLRRLTEKKSSKGFKATGRIKF